MTGEVDVYLEFSTHERCDTRCRDADPANAIYCTCSCLGSNHGGVASWKHWLTVGKTTLIADGGIEERHIVIRRGQIPDLDKRT